MLEVLLWWGLGFGEVVGLGSDEFVVRERSEVRLKGRLPLTVPGLMVGARMQDLETRRRAERILKPWVRQCEEKCLDALVWYLVYGPDQITGSRNSRYRRYLSAEWQNKILYWPKWLKVEVYERASKLTIARGSMADEDGAWWPVGYLNVLRNRAAGLGDYGEVD